MLVVDKVVGDKEVEVVGRVRSCRGIRIRKEWRVWVRNEGGREGTTAERKGRSTCHAH